LSLLFALGLLLGASTSPEPLDSVVLKMEQTTDRQQTELCGYSVDRRYTLQNKHLSPDAVMTVRLVYKRGVGKHFEAPSISETPGLVHRALLNLLREEEESSREHEKSTEFNSANYDFALLDLERLGEQACYRVRLKPRRRSKYLIEGEAWIDAREYAVVQVQGQLAQKPSFWVHPPEVEQKFAEFQSFWLPSYNRSLASVAFVGEAVLTIEYSNYQVKSCR
jgi:hypothetical protein